MKIYQSEISDGLQDVILNNNTIACCALAEPFQPTESQVDALHKILASSSGDGEIALAENKDQFDLYYMKSILVSTGWNKNDDVFDPKELWDARNTPEDKPFNFMHKEEDIIGHITANEVVDFDGNTINDFENLPNQFNILTSAVIYTEWSDPDRKARIQNIVQEIEENKWFVSMECLFPNFDYALADENSGELKVLKRDEATAFLTKHLRSYGGDGKYSNYRIGRLLRDLSFSGKGLVSKPANPRSIILDTNNNDFFDESKAETLTTFNEKKEIRMSDTHDKQIEDLRAELAEAKAANEALKEKVVAEQQAEFETKIQDLEATIAEQSAKIDEQTSACETLSESLKQAEEALAGKDEEMKKKDDELKAMKKKEAMLKRKASLLDAGMEDEEAASALEQFESVDDETFDKIVALYGKKGKKEEKEEGMKEEGMKEKASEQEEEVDSAEASEEVLESVEETSEVAIAEAVGEEDPVENLRSVASEWLGSVLKYSKED